MRKIKLEILRNKVFLFIPAEILIKNYINNMERAEERIREKLSLKLEIFGNGLSLIKQEFFLPNQKGTRGFVDLLARNI